MIIRTSLKKLELLKDMPSKNWTTLYIGNKAANQELAMHDQSDKKLTNVNKKKNMYPNP